MEVKMQFETSKMAKIYSTLTILLLPLALMAEDAPPEDAPVATDACQERYLEVKSEMLEKVPFKECYNFNMDEDEIEDQGGITENNIAFVMAVMAAAPMGSLGDELTNAAELRAADIYSCEKAAIVIMNFYSPQSCVFAAILTTNNPEHRFSGWTPADSGFKVWSSDAGIIEDTTLEVYMFADEGDINASDIKELF